MDVVIRKAERSDVPAMLALVKELAVFEREPDAVVVTEEEMAEAGFGKDPVWFGWVAEMRSEVIGIAVCYERYSTWKGRCLYLEDLVVKESARRSGIGQRLFNECINYGRREGYRTMSWQVLDWNTNAIRFYERFGARIWSGWWNGTLPLK